MNPRNWNLRWDRSGHEGVTTWPGIWVQSCGSSGRKRKSTPASCSPTSICAHTQNKCYKVRQVIRMIPFKESNNRYRRKTIPKASRTLRESIRQIFLFLHPILGFNQGPCTGCIHPENPVCLKQPPNPKSGRTAVSSTHWIREEGDREKDLHTDFWGKESSLSFIPSCAVLLWCLWMLVHRLSQALVRTFRNFCGGVSLSPVSEYTSVSHLVCIAPVMFCKLIITEDILLVL